MKTPQKHVRGVLEDSAHQLAFRIGQSVEQTLVARAVHFAGRNSSESGKVIVTAEHIRRALDENLIGDACSKIGIFLNGKTKIRLPISRAG